MLLPESFNTAIASVFYDKSFSISRKTRSKDAEGGVVIALTLVGTFNGNVQNSVSTGTRKSLGIEVRGLVDSLTLTVTTSRENDIRVDDELEYSGKKYTVKASPPRDSHLLLVCETA